MTSIFQIEDTALVKWIKVTNKCCLQETHERTRGLELGDPAHAREDGRGPGGEEPGQEEGRVLRILGPWALGRGRRQRGGGLSAPVGLAAPGLGDLPPASRGDPKGRWRDPAGELADPLKKKGAAEQGRRKKAEAGAAMAGPARPSAADEEAQRTLQDEQVADTDPGILCHLPASIKLISFQAGKISDLSWFSIRKLGPAS
uniref:zinc finger CCHC domain-containing protein 3 n=1 Tax=Ictidomys tridecemlineatus TaxID=43179 RepID=UPI001A9D5FD9|nr:zinc finger CCHC domain-containing protein 3 [Ictidomys tridecemlineatus]